MSSSNGVDLIRYAKRIKENLCRCCRCKNIYSNNMFCESHLKKKYPYCSPCRKLVGKISRRKSLLKVTYNLTLDEYNLMLKEQKYKCAICLCKENHVNHHTNEILHLTVDHCHLTGKVRGLLCRNCNLMIGNSKDSQKSLKNAIIYLKKYK